MATYTSLETADTEMYPGLDFAETETSNIDYTAAPTDENEWNPTYDLRREPQLKASSEKTTKKWRVLLHALLAAAVVSSGVAAGKYAMKAEPGSPVTPPPPVPKVKPEPELLPVVPLPVKPEIKPPPKPTLVVPPPAKPEIQPEPKPARVVPPPVKPKIKPAPEPPPVVPLPAKPKITPATKPPLVAPLPAKPEIKPAPELPPVVPPRAKPKITPAPNPPPGKTRVPLPTPLLPPSLVETLTEPRFLAPFPVGEDEVKGLVEIFNTQEVFNIKGFHVLREQLIEALEGNMVDASLLEVYSKLVQEHIDVRVSQKLQKDVVIIGPAMFSQHWQDYFMKKLPPYVPAEVDIRRCKQASKVLIALPAPLGNAAIGHFLLAVIDQDRKTIFVVDSLPREKEYYTPITAFIKTIAEQLNGDPSKPFSIYSDIPARGFPVQAEGLTENDSLYKEIYSMDALYTSILSPESEGSLLDDSLHSELFNACGLMTLENMLCIAENRVPNYNANDAMALRLRIVSELFDGIWGRSLVNGEFRSSGAPQ